jgi:hypothetical protein
MDAELQGKMEESKFLKEHLKSILDQLEDKFNRSVDCLSKSYDQYMKSIAPAPQFLPVRIRVVFHSKPFAMNIENISIEQFENSESLLK